MPIPPDICSTMKAFMATRSTMVDVLGPAAPTIASLEVNSKDMKGIILVGYS